MLPEDLIQKTGGRTLLLALDPGTLFTGVALIDLLKLFSDDKFCVNAFKHMANTELLELVRVGYADQWFLVSEGFEFQGQQRSAGIETFLACEFSGKVKGIWEYRTGLKAARVFPSERKSFFGAKNDTEMKTALHDMFGPGKDLSVGKKKTPGPLFGMVKHSDMALAVGIAWAKNPQLRNKLELEEEIANEKAIREAAKAAELRPAS